MTRKDNGHNVFFMNDNAVIMHLTHINGNKSKVDLNQVAKITPKFKGVEFTFKDKSTECYQESIKYCLFILQSIPIHWELYERTKIYDTKVIYKAPKEKVPVLPIGNKKEET